MGIKGILFDKDGTLLQFGTVWIKVMNEVIDDILDVIGETGNKALKNRLCLAIGLNDDKVDEKGLLASGTTVDMAQAFQAILPENIPFLEQWMADKIYVKTQESIDCVKPVCDLSALFSALKQKGMIIGIATADDFDTTVLCLKHLGVQNDIQFLGTSDLFEKKPSSQIVDKFCEQFGLENEEIAFVGDTLVDLQTAKNGEVGHGIGVLSGVGSERELQSLADFVIPNIEYLINGDDKFIWESELEGKKEATYTP
ncbi:HAD family hydrolase [Bacillaceae bacterium SIJ1]|uniref:HAD family hydrolase n=1 Tax=Litoribacterium kuwaitense TaxID=1398745 RepID=UPI0013ECC4B4|nr:HAD family hydrolase [Litoribacterium kuwaitense]NGP44529.1 HAD family hydrolase [Litoribacterium kuwaitense]